MPGKKETQVIQLPPRVDLGDEGNYQRSLRHAASAVFFPFKDGSGARVMKHPVQNAGHLSAELDLAGL